MRVASICAASALAFGFIHSPALAQNPPPTPLPTISEREEVRNTYIFKFDDSVDRGEMHARAQQALAGSGGNLRHVYTDVLGGFAATVPATAVWNVARRPGIVWFERDQIATIFAKPSWAGGGDKEEDTNTGSGEIADCEGTYPAGVNVPWGVKRINAPSAHSNKESDGVTTKDPNCGQGIHVYVLDTGIDLDHPDLTPLDGVDCTSGCVPGGDDKNGHGTHVAGTIAARINSTDVVGVAPAVHLHAVQVLGASGRGSYSDIIAGIDHVAGEADPNKEGGSNLGPVVANLSLGGSGTKSGTCSSNGFEPNGGGDGSRGLHQAMCEAANLGVVFVVAAGNSDADAEGFVPAAYDDTVITVSATARVKCDGADSALSCNDWPYWSNWGNGTESPSAAPPPAPVAIAAPGVSILSTAKGGGTTTMSGTSMASPHMAGVAALLLRAAKVNDTDGVGYPATFEAFDSVRNDMLNIGASTGGDSFKNTSKNPHAEKFGCAAAGCPTTP